MTSLRLYAFPESPPTCAVTLALEALGLDYTVITFDYIKEEHLSEEFAHKNPQRELPLLDDDGFLLSESVAILQYLGDKYDTAGKLYPKDIQQRAIVNHRLAFNISSYYHSILDYAINPIIFDYPQTSSNLKKMKTNLSAFNSILERQGTKFSAGDSLTIADFALVAATVCLESVDYDLSDYSSITKWYADFKKEYPNLWSKAEKVMLILHEISKSLPDLSTMNHPYYPIRKK